AVVFNAQQMDGLAPYQAPERSFDPVERAENLLASGGVPIIHDQRDRAFYRPDKDEIHIPDKSSFRDQSEYYATALHELGHSTGHKSRMAREPSPFGSKAFALEKLRAEIASFMVTTDMGLGHYPDRHARYAGEWAKAIREEPSVLFAVARDAANIRTWVVEPGQRRSLMPAKAPRPEIAPQQAESIHKTVPAQPLDFATHSRKERENVIDGMFNAHWNANPTLWAMELQDALVLTGGRDNQDLLAAPELKAGLFMSDLATDHLKRFISQTAERADWGNVGRQVLEGREDQLRFAGIAEEFGRIAWEVEPKVGSEAVPASISHRESTLAAMSIEARRSPVHAELLSAVWSIDGPARGYEKPDWFVSPSERRDGFLKRLSGSLDLHHKLSPDLPHTIEKTTPLNISDIRTNWVSVVAPMLFRASEDIASLEGAFKKMGALRSPDSQINAGRNHRLAEIAGVAAKSPDHQELVSAMWDSAMPVSSNKPEWYVPAEKRENRVVKALGAFPERGLLDLFVNESEMVPSRRPVVDLAASRENKAMPLEQEMDRKRQYLNVPYSERNEAKGLGARWDRKAKAWYVNDGTDMKPFGKWAAIEERAVPSKLRPEDEFALACREQGLILDGAPQMDGKWHRVAVEGDAHGQKSGSYRGFIEGIPAGLITNYKMAEGPRKWVSSAAEINPEELERSKAAAAARKAQQEADLKAQYTQVAKQAYAMFKNADLAPSSHVYLERKQVTGETLKVDKAGRLLVPLTNERGFIENVQSIAPDGTKMYLKNGRKSGLMHMLPGKKDGPIIIAEGYATAKSLQQATGFTTVVAFDGGNLAPVAETLAKQHPERPLVIAAEDDHRVFAKLNRNPGIEAAHRASERSGAKVITPDLTPEEKVANLTDYNDLHVSRGFETFKNGVQRQLRDAGVGVAANKAQKAGVVRQQQKTSDRHLAM
ncbi:hypothetical protein COB52_05975, partial [Candidatus Kaiserbacteria bacterium]